MWWPQVAAENESHLLISLIIANEDLPNVRHGQYREHILFALGMYTLIEDSQRNYV